MQGKESIDLWLIIIRKRLLTNLNISAMVKTLVVDMLLTVA